MTLWLNQSREPHASESSLTVAVSPNAFSVSDPPREILNFASLTVAPAFSLRHVPKPRFASGVRTFSNLDVTVIVPA